MTWAQDTIRGMQKLPDGSPVAFGMLRRGDLPLVIDVFDEESGVPAWTTTVTEAGPLTIPGFYPRRVCVLLSYLGSGVRVLSTSTGQSYHWAEESE